MAHRLFYRSIRDTHVLNLRLGDRVPAGKFTAAYEPPDGQSEINMKGTFGPNGGDGEWSLGAKDQASSPAVASGTWKIAKP